MQSAGGVVMVFGEFVRLFVEFGALTAGFGFSLWATEQAFRKLERR